MTRPRAPWVTTALVLVAVVATLVATSPSGAPRTTVPSPAPVAVPGDSREATRVVCRRVLVDFADQVARDASAREVLDDLATTVAVARQAATGDPALQPLAGGVGALLESLDTDDPGAAALAMRVIRAACADEQVDP